MTIAALVGHFAASTPRYVTVNGQIVFDAVTAVAGGTFVHAVHGSVTPVQKHAFHGGSDENGVNMAEDARWWDRHELIQRHIDSMELAFPNFAYLPPVGDAAPAWIGVIDTGRGAFEIGVALREDQGLPRIAMVGKVPLGRHVGRKWVRAPHLYDGGTLCVAEVSDWDPLESTAATATAWAAHWLACYTEWRMTRKWPVAGVDAHAA